MCTRTRLSDLLNQFTPDVYSYLADILIQIQPFHWCVKRQHFSTLAASLSYLFTLLVVPYHHGIMMISKSSINDLIVWGKLEMYRYAMQFYLHRPCQGCSSCVGTINTADGRKQAGLATIKRHCIKDRVSVKKDIINEMAVSNTNLHDDLFK